MPMGWQELAVILLIVIVIFGANKLPEIGSGLGKGIRGFKEESGLEKPKTSQSEAIEPSQPRERMSAFVHAQNQEADIRADEI